MQGKLKIGQAARVTGLTVKAVRFYEAAGVLPPPQRTEGGYRLYGSEEIRRLMLIKQARGIGFTLEQTGEYVDLVGAGCCPTIRPGMKALIAENLRHLDERIHDLAALRAVLWELSQKLSTEVETTACTPDTCVPSAEVPVTFFIEGVPKNTHADKAQGRPRRVNSHDRSAAPPPRSGR